MPRRYDKKVHDALYKFVAARDGEYCLDPSCRRAPPRTKLELDHADNNPHNWDPDNLHLLCQRHNLAMRHLTRSEHVKLIRSYSDVNEREREISKGHTTAPDIRQMVDYRTGSIEMQANSYLEPVWFDIARNILLAQGQAEKKDFINSLALASGCNPITSRRYLEKYASSLGPFIETKEAGYVVIKLRHPSDGGTMTRGKGTHGAAPKISRRLTVPETAAQPGGADAGE